MKKLFEKLIIDKFFIPLLFLAPFSGTSFADNQTSTFKCPTWDMHEIQVPVDAHSRDNREFSFKFQWIQKNVDSPTIIFVPGGPGSGSISESTVEDRDEVIKETYEYLGVPDTFNLILTDPRAVGCNGDFRFEEGDLSSELFADDLVAMIKSTGIKDYILYAHSYGTVLATIVAAKAGNGEAREPMAVVLAGTIGKAYQKYTESAAANLVLQWEKLKSSLKPQSQTVIEHGADGTFGGISLGVLDFAVFKGLNEAASVQSDGTFKYPLRETLNLLGSEKQDEYTHLQDYFNSLPASSPMHFYADENNRLVKPVQCREIDVYNFDIEMGNDGKLVKKGTNVCPMGSLGRPFDSKKWQIKSPIYYVAGTLDPSTPYEGVVYHFNNQVLSSKKFFISIPEGGHLLVSGALGDCKNLFWQSLATKDGTDLNSVLSRCIAKPELKAQFNH